MKAVVWTGPRQMEIQNIDRPEPGHGELLIRIDAVGICGSELSGFLGENSLRVPPLIMGHEFAGEVAAIGPGVVGHQLGERVTVNPLLTCGSCPSCLMGLESLCATRQLIGVHRSGAFAEFVTAPAANCLPMPDGMSAVTGSLAEPLACGVRAARLGGVSQGSRVVILGAGAIGLMCIAAVRKAGGSATMSVEVNPGRLVTAASWGAEKTCDARTQDPAAVIKELTGGQGADVVIDAVGSSITRRTAVDLARPGGTVVLVGLHEAESVFAANHIIRSEIKLTGSFAYTREDFAQAVSMLAAGDLPTSGDWLETRELEACAASFTQLVDDPPAAAKITLIP